MSKFYLLGSTKVFRSLILMAVAAGSYQSLQAQCTVNANTAPCTGGNVNQNFNSENGQFTSAQFTYSSANGNFAVANALANSTNTISSGVYHWGGATGALVGFSFVGSTAGLNDITVSIVNNATGTPFISCTQTANTYTTSVACVTFSNLSIGAGTDIRYEFTFTVKNGGGQAGTIVFDNFANAGQAAALPVKLDNFDAAKDGSGIKLSWIAATEDGVVRYEVQRSSDGVNFKTIGSVTAENKRSYSYLDVLPSSGNNFYRLRIVDLDNTAKISHVVSLKSKLSVGIEAYPNPVRDRMVVQHPKAVMGTRLQLISLTGQVLKDVQVPANAVVTPVDVTGLSNGTYYIVFRSGSESFSQRITKQ